MPPGHLGPAGHDVGARAPGRSAPVRRVPSALRRLGPHPGLARWLLSRIDVTATDPAPARAPITRAFARRTALTRGLLPAAALTILSGCASRAPALVERPAPQPRVERATSAPAILRPSLPDPGPMAEAWILPARILDVKRKRLITEDELLDDLLEARAIYVGEQHDNPHEHAAQLRILAMLHDRDPSLGVGMEMFERPYQKPLNDYLHGRIEEEQLLTRTEWDERWGFDFTLYRPILEFARNHQVPIYALNAPREVTREVARAGLQALDAQQRARVPELDLTDHGHRDALSRFYERHDRAHAELSFDNFYAAQVVWDETMADEVARQLSREAGPERVVVLAGSAHVRFRSAIPERAARRGASPYRIIIPVVLGSGADLESLLADAEADYLWVMAPDEELLPPEPTPPLRVNALPLHRGAGQGATRATP